MLAYLNQHLFIAQVSSIGRDIGSWAAVSLMTTLDRIHRLNCEQTETCGDQNEFVNLLRGSWMNSEADF